MESDTELALICEDDAFVLTALPNKYLDYKSPDDADLIFVNCRMGDTVIQGSNVLSLEKMAFQYVPVIEVLRRSEQKRKRISSPGCDGYILTRNGAKAALKIYREKKITVEVDWFQLIYSLSAADWELLMKHEKTNHLSRFIGLEPAKNHLRSYIMLPSLISQDSFGTTFDRSPAGYFERTKMC